MPTKRQPPSHQEIRRLLFRAVIEHDGPGHDWYVRDVFGDGRSEDSFFIGFDRIPGTYHRIGYRIEEEGPRFIVRLAEMSTWEVVAQEWVTLNAPQSLVRDEDLERLQASKNPNASPDDAYTLLPTLYLDDEGNPTNLDEVGEALQAWLGEEKTHAPTVIVKRSINGGYSYDARRPLQKRSNGLRYRNLPVSIGLKDVDASQGIVCGYFSSFGELDSYREIVEPGAFARSIREWGPSGTHRQGRIKHLWQHVVLEPIGVPQVLREDDFGLYFETRISKTRRGRDALVLYEDGVIDEHSIGFEILPGSTRHDKDENITYLTEVRLWEGSSVTWGANMETPTVDVRSSSQCLDRLSCRMQAMEKVLRHRDISDETGYDLEIMLRQCQADFERLSKLAEPNTETEEKAEADKAETAAVLQALDSFGATFDTHLNPRQ